MKYNGLEGLSDYGEMRSTTPLFSAFATPVPEELKALYGNEPYKYIAEAIKQTRCFNALWRKTQIQLDTSLDETGYAHPKYNRRIHTEVVERDAVELAEALGLNVELTQVIALAHDVGHVAGGHKGEQTLKKIVSDISDGKHDFSHPNQAVINLQAETLNLSSDMEVGIINHTNDEFVDKSRKAEGVFTEIMTHKSKTCPEGILVQIADNISSTLHDIDDLMQMGVLTKEKALNNAEFKNSLARFDVTIDELFNATDEILSKMRKGVIECIIGNTKVIDGRLSISLGEMTQALYALRAANYKFFDDPVIAAQNEIIEKNVQTICDYYIEHENELDANLRKILTASSDHISLSEERKQYGLKKVDAFMMQPFEVKLTTFYTMHNDIEINTMVHAIEMQKKNIREKLDTIHNETHNNNPLST
ncbi:MAG: HD domain-containing protein [Clostridiales bacterium]|jgi:dGTPase|nr:HD domain-containing protein [Clostridiales bacterium]